MVRAYDYDNLGRKGLLLYQDGVYIGENSTGIFDGDLPGGTPGMSITLTWIGAVSRCDGGSANVSPTINTWKYHPSYWNGACRRWW